MEEKSLSQSQEISSLRASAEDTHTLLRKTQQLASDRDLLLKEKAREMSDMQLELTRRGEEVERLRQEDTSLGGKYDKHNDGLVLEEHRCRMLLTYLLCFAHPSTHSLSAQPIIILAELFLLEPKSFPTPP